jgi:rfaE bifunctional protein nucleotidyltransferase chain/domain
MNYIDKIKSREELKASIDQSRSDGKTVVLCHGCFDILHPGHVRHLAWAKRQGDLLAVTVSGDDVIQKGASRPFVPQNLRAENLAALEVVDHVSIDSGEWAGPILDFVRPDIYVKGKEFESVYSGRFGNERKLVADYGGQVRFSSGDVVFSSTKIIQRFGDELASSVDLDAQFRSRNRIDLGQLRDCIDKLTSLRVLIIGDLYLSEEFSCDAGGTGSDTHGLEWQSQVVETRVGGAAAMAQYLAGMGTQIRLFGLLGEDAEGDKFSQEISNTRIQNQSIALKDGRTLVRTRYSSESQVLLNVRNNRNFRLPTDVESQFNARITEAIEDVEVIIIVDDGYGTVTDEIVAHLGKLGATRGIPIIGKVACRPPIADILRLRGISLLVCTERTARMSLNDPDGGVADLGAVVLRDGQSRCVAISLEEGGYIMLDSKGQSLDDLRSLNHSHELKQRLAIEFLAAPLRSHRPQFSGISVFTGITALGMGTGIGMMEAAYLGKCAALAASHQMPGSVDELAKFVEMLFINATPDPVP